MTSSMSGTKYARHRIGDTLRCGSPYRRAFDLDNGRPFMSGWKRYILVWRFTAATARPRPFERPGFLLWATFYLT